MSKEEGLKSAYERALEKLEQSGIEPPREEAYSPEVIAEMDDVRSRAEASLAELDIRHRGKLATLGDPTEREKEEADYRAEVERIESARDRKLDRLRTR